MAELRGPAGGTDPVTHLYMAERISQESERKPSPTSGRVTARSHVVNS